jgi:tetratricopeptide (TPR) repeat protein
MAAPEHRDNSPLPPPDGASAPSRHGEREEAASHDVPLPLKLQFEVTLPQELGGELKAWRKTFERFTDVMERWLESSLAHPNFPAPPAMPWLAPSIRSPEQPIPQPPARVETLPPPVSETVRTSSLAASPEHILPDEMPVLLVDETRPFQLEAPARPAKEEKSATRPAKEEKTAPAKTIEVRSTPPPLQPVAAARQDVSTLERAAEHAQRGERHRAAGQKEQALDCYREALTLDADCTQAYLGRASVYIEQGRLQEALLDCNTALRHEPQRAVLYVLRGLVYTRLGNLKRALDEADDAIRFDAKLPSAYMLRGAARFKKGMVGEALADVKEAIRLRPNDAKFHAELGRLLAHTGQHEQAARIYGKVLELSPNFHEARFLRGVALRQAGDAADAEAELSEYLRRCPRTAAGHYQRGLCRLAQRNYAQAMTDFDKAIALKPDDQAARAAKQQTLDLWEGTARQARSGEMAATASTVARAATATDMPPAMPTQSNRAVAKPTPAKSAPTKAKPAPKRGSTRSRDDDEPARWVRPAKWVCTVLLVGLLGFGSFRLLANVMNNPYKAEDGPPASATLSADELFQRYLGNPANAKAELSDHYVEVRGPVARQFEDKNPPVVMLAVTRSNATVNCTLKANPILHQQMMLSRIEGECQVSIVGLCAGPQGNSIALSECRIIKVAKGRGAPRR